MLLHPKKYLKYPESNKNAIIHLLNSLRMSLYFRYFINTKIKYFQSTAEKTNATCL